jgi:hypothetical protein
MFHVEHFKISGLADWEQKAMMCRSPVYLTKPYASGGPVACGQCIACRLNRKRFWVGRMLLEHHFSGHSFFVTLTYNDDNVPTHLGEDGNPVQTLDPYDFKKWTMRWRKRFGKLRFFGVGEYGDRTQRPHYHAVIFNESPHTVEWKVRQTWNEESKGFSMVSEFNDARARYVAAYTVKKMNAKHPALGDRAPEFARMSRLPPLGYMGMKAIESQLSSRAGAQAIAERQSLPDQFRYEGKLYPIGDYWKGKLEERLGYEFPKKETLYEKDPEEWWITLAQSKKVCAKIERRAEAKGYV